MIVSVMLVGALSWYHRPPAMRSLSDLVDRAAAAKGVDADALGELASRRPAAVIAEFRRRGAFELEAKRVIIEALAVSGKPSATMFLLDLAASSRDTIGDQAATALTSMGSEAIGPLRDAGIAGTPGQSDQAVEILADIGPDALPALLDIARARDRDTSESGIMACFAIGRITGVHALMDIDTPSDVCDDLLLRIRYGPGHR